MGITADKVIKIAKGEIGYLEKRSHANLDSKTKNAGSANYTKYGHETGLGCGVYWCAEFVCWVFMKAGGNKQSAKMCLRGSFSAACETIRRAFINCGQYSSSPRPGDLIFFKGTRHAGANHIGIVTKVGSGNVWTVEGNTSGGSSVVDNGGGVAAKCYSRGYSKILGYGHPKYTAETKTTPEKKTEEKKTTSSKKTTTADLNVRTGPGTQYTLCKTFGPLKKGERVEILQDAGNNWYLIRTETGKRGYVSGKYLK